MSHAPVNDRIQPTPHSPRGTFVATVKENRTLCTDHYRLILSLPRFPKNAPGQFIQLDCRDPHADPDLNCTQEPHSFDWPPISPAPSPAAVATADADFTAPLAYLRRPFSIADCRTAADGSVELDVIHRVVGRGTQLLARLQAGERLSFLGPLGIGFDLPADLDCALLVGGGVGIPPMLYLAKALAARGVKNIVAILGTQRRDLLPVTLLSTAPEPSPEGDPVLNVEELAPYHCPAIITTDDGSLGMKGYVTGALKRFLQHRQTSPAGLARTLTYCCGPTPMMKATARVATEFAVPCMVSLEQPMACGMGTCQSCIIKYRPHTAPPESDWKYKLTCTDGPVFDSRDILW